LLRRAIDLLPAHPVAWQVLSEQKLLQGLGREGHAIALQGLSVVGTDRDLWTLVSESYVAKGDFEAAVRARWAAFGAAPPTAGAWSRMAQLMELAGRSEDAAAALERARGLEVGAAGPTRESTSVPGDPR
jgi:tetratricopeptide (TPR) repeat protein